MRRGRNPIDTPGGTQALTVISEAGLYRVLMRSHAKLSRPFQDWVTRDVLPAIRKDGGYVMGEAAI